jgi:hypothetical protein
MKLGTILTACDLNPLYSEFIPMFVTAWNTLVPSADVVIVLIADTIPEELKAYEKNIRLFAPLPNIHTAFQAQCIRLLYPSQITRDEGVLITDMDMIPLNSEYYTKHIENIPDDNFVVYRDVCLPNEISMCYNIASPSTWKSVFENDSLEKWYSNTNYDGNSGGHGWNTDQLILVKRFNDWNGPKVILNDRITNFRRLDRYALVFNNLQHLEQLVKSKFYADYHCFRPYSKYKKTNDLILSFLRENLV